MTRQWRSVCKEHHAKDSSIISDVDSNIRLRCQGGVLDKDVFIFFETQSEHLSAITYDFQNHYIFLLQAVAIMLCRYLHNMIKFTTKNKCFGMYCMSSKVSFLVFIYLNLKEATTFIFQILTTLYTLLLLSIIEMPYSIQFNYSYTNLRGILKKLKNKKLRN